MAYETAFQRYNTLHTYIVWQKAKEYYTISIDGIQNIFAVTCRCVVECIVFWRGVLLLLLPVCMCLKLLAKLNLFSYKH